jgi:hypothetical protein
VEPGLLLGFAFANVEGRDPLGASLPEFVFTNGTTSSVQVCGVLVAVVAVVAVEGGLHGSSTQALALMLPLSLLCLKCAFPLRTLPTGARLCRCSSTTCPMGATAWPSLAKTCCTSLVTPCKPCLLWTGPPQRATFNCRWVQWVAAQGSGGRGHAS